MNYLPNIIDITWIIVIVNLDIDICVFMCIYKSVRVHNELIYIIYVRTISGMVKYVLMNTFFNCCKAINVSKWVCRGCQLDPTPMLKSVFGE
jgi:hypothetical protein